ncbi:MAG TPA: ABC transporter permease subunit [Candidatus Limnocylindrales bacterium]|nr:ABC transporter permease subunit [Candidatus Limnocylindrales bacterium]
MTIFATVTAITIRALVGRRRTLLMLLLAGMPVLLGLIIRVNEDNLGLRILGQTIDGIVIRTVLPLIALVFGTAALGSELEDGTGVHLLTKPINRSVIVVSKALVAGTLTAVLVVPSTVLGGFLMGGLGGDAIGVTFAFALASLIGSFLYAAIFLVLSSITTRGLIIGLAYAIIWEGLVAGLLPGSQVFSVREYLTGIVQTLTPEAVGESLVGTGGFLYAAVAFVLALAIGSVRLARYEVRGAE